MRYQVPFSLCSSLAAYLRQIALSLHRATSLSQFIEFLRCHSVSPRIVLSDLTLHVGHKEHLPKVDWATLARRSHSIPTQLGQKLQMLLFGAPSSVWLSEIEMGALLEVLHAVDEWVEQSSEASQEYKNDIRQKMDHCVDFLLRRISNQKLRLQIQHVEHLNSAIHLQTCPIGAVDGWFWR